MTVRNYHQTLEFPANTNFETERQETSLIQIIDARQNTGTELLENTGTENTETELLEKLQTRSRLEHTDVLKSVAEIIDTVRKSGDEAVIKYTRLFDGVEITSDNMKVSQDEIDRACANVDKKLLDVIRKAKCNIEAFHMKQKENSWFTTGENGIFLGQLYRPLETVGVYVPGGTAALASSVLMNIVPAKVAGVENVIMVTPPGRDGRINEIVLAAAACAGADSIFRIGGAQAVAALAFGTQTVPGVDKIFGPGNIYVSTAKRLVFGYCDIDMFAGPSEITIIADDKANPRFVAADLMSQAEHDALASAILVTTSEKLAAEVRREIGQMYLNLDRKEILQKSLSEYGAVIIVENLEKAVEFVNKIAPEHLELCIEDPFSLLGAIKNAGAIFLGSYSPEPLGDYFAGPNHILPTSGTARFFSPLTVSDFIKKSSVISYTGKALQKVRDDIILFAEAEGLTAHANAIKVRFDM